MNRRYLFAGSALVLSVVVAASIVRCDFPVGAFTSFSYIPHERPRVFVSHHPLRAMPGERVSIRLTPDLRAEDGAIGAAKAGLRRLSSSQRDEIACTQVGARFECQFTLPAADAEYVYDGHLELQNGTRVNALAAYRFRAAATIGSNEVMLLREPVNTIKGLASTYRIDTAWVRDPGDAYSFGDFVADVETSVYEGILADPVYRWRDNQLAFHVFGSPGFTSSYYSGLDTRCGQNPWPQESALRSALDAVEVIGVLHRHPGTASGIEGTVAEAPDLAGVFRDCAGTAVRNSDIRTFSAVGGAAGSPRVAKHEFGHAAFGLGDEYPESNSSRNVAPASVNPLDNACCCVSGSDTGPGTGTGTVTPGTGTVIPNTVTADSGPSAAGESSAAPRAAGANLGLEPFGVQTRQCVVAGGGIETGPAPPGGNLPACTGAFPPQCGAAPQGACPSLLGECVQSGGWLGQAAPAGDTSRPNIYPTQSACEAGRARAVVHPGVENRGRSLDSLCHQICGGTLAACPCGQTEGWIVDLNPAAAPAPPGAADSMASVLAERHGGTCAWCVETSLCVRWQRARGDMVAEAWSYCDAPPTDAAARERWLVALARGLSDLIRDLTRHWQF